jgi:hypothetical protein
MAGQGEELPWPVIDRYLMGGSALTPTDAAAVEIWVAGHPERRAELDLLQRVVHAPMAYPELPTPDALWSALSRRLTSPAFAPRRAPGPVALWRRRVLVEFAGVAAVALVAVLLRVPRPAPRQAPSTRATAVDTVGVGVGVGYAAPAAPAAPAGPVAPEASTPAPAGAASVAAHSRRVRHAPVGSVPESTATPANVPASLAAVDSGARMSVPAAGTVAVDSAADGALAPEPDPPTPWGPSDADGVRGRIALAGDYGSPGAAGGGWP